MRFLASAFVILASPVVAVPAVLTDIAPIHGFVSDVMGDLGVPVLLLSPNSDGHDYAMRPSDAQAISDAEIIVRVGDALTPWLSEPLATLAPDAPVLSLLETAGWTPREVRDADGLDHGGIDPHAWLDPQVAAIWVVRIADALGQADPENAETYAQNAMDAALRYAALEASITETLTPVVAQKLVWPHDAYGYFAERFSLTSVAAIAEADASAPGPAHVAKLRALAVSGAVDCVLLDVEVNARWGQILTDGTEIPSAEIDPVGVGIPLGQGFYDTLLTQLSQAIAGCQ